MINDYAITVMNVHSLHEAIDIYICKCERFRACSSAHSHPRPDCRLITYRHRLARAPHLLLENRRRACVARQWSVNQVFHITYINKRERTCRLSTYRHRFARAAPAPRAPRPRFKESWTCVARQERTARAARGAVQHCS